MEKNYRKNDFILIIAAVLLLILSGGAIFWSFNVKNNNSVSQALPPKIIGQAALTIDFGNGERRAFEGDIVENETLIGVLTQASKAGDFSYKLDKKSDLAAIEEFTTDGKKSWHWYLNGKKIDKLPSETIIEDGDKILIMYE